MSLPKIFVASFNRASDGAIELIVKKLEEEIMFSGCVDECDYILACGDRKELFDFCLYWWRKGKKIIHLWAGEVSQGTHDEVYRWAITHMSMMALCTTPEAKQRVIDFYDTVGSNGCTRIVGNVMLDNMPNLEYDVVLYNPVIKIDQIDSDVKDICLLLKGLAFWFPPNGDVGSSKVDHYVNMPNLPRAQYLAILKHCRRFITNSSSAYYEAQFLLYQEQIVIIGERNKERSSKYENMAIPNASDNIIKILKELK